jgi:Flp pilus assembly protein TadG
MRQAFRPEAEATAGERIGRGGSSVIGRVRRLVKDASGAAAVEFAILVWPFILLVFGALQVSLIIFMNQILQTTAVQAGRQYMTGQVAGDGQAQFVSVVEGLLPGFFNKNNLMVDVQLANSATALAGEETPLTYTTTCTGTPQVCTVTQGSYTASAPKEYAILRILYELPLMGGGFGFSNQPNGSYLMTGTSVFRVEPYPS